MATVDRASEARPGQRVRAAPLAASRSRNPGVSDPLAGRGLLQSPAEWAVRNCALADALLELINANVRIRTGRALDVGCQTGELTDLLAAGTPLTWTGIDPRLEYPARSPNGSELLPGWAHRLPFPAEHFDCVILANVYEHLAPRLRTASLREIRRVLVDGGSLVGQLPNPYFPIESHSRLPFMGWLPYSIQKLYWRLAPVPWEHDFYVVTVTDVQRRAAALGFETRTIRRFNYPHGAIPRSIRWTAPLVDRLMRVVPWSWQFVFGKRSAGEEHHNPANPFGPD